MSRSVRIVSNGSHYGTHVYDEESGAEIENICSIDIHLEGGSVPKANITVFMPTMELKGVQAEIVLGHPVGKLPFVRVQPGQEEEPKKEKSC